MVLTLKERCFMIRPWGYAIIALYIVMIIFWSTVGHSADFATYMRVVGHNKEYVKVVDEDGQQWEVRCRNAISNEGDVIEKHDIVLVIMDLRYDSVEGVMRIGDSYIETKLKKK